MTKFIVISLSLFVSGALRAETSTEKYSVQSGDNLSSISKTLFGDATYWPKIWSSKKQTPHLVAPGKSIRLFLGNEDEAPAFAISEADDADDIASTPLRAVADSRPGLVTIPPSRFPPKPVLKVLPHSFPEWQRFRRVGGKFKDYDVDILPRLKINPEDRQILPVYAEENAVRSEGQYLHAAEDSTVAFDGDEVFVKMKKGVGQTGAHYLLVHDGGALEQTPYRKSGNPSNAHIVEVLGEIELGGTVDSKPSNEWDYHRAKMVKALGLSLNESDIIPGRMTTVSLSSNGTPSGLSAEIIGGNFDSKGLNFGEGSWVFINKGAKDGVTANQLLWVNTNLEARGDDSPIYVGNTRAALVKVVRTADGISTGIVLSSKEALTQGDTSGIFSSAERPSKDDGGGALDDLGSDLKDDGGGSGGGESDDSGLDLGDSAEAL